MIIENPKQNNNSKRNDLLKFFAMLTMLIDHIGYLFFPNILLFRTIGRMAFPIFAYQLSIGYSKTSNLRKYISRLIVFGFITYIPYSVFNPSLEFNPYKLNIMFTLAVSLIFIHLYEQAKDNFKIVIEKKEIKYILVSILAIFLMFSILMINSHLASNYPQGGLEYGWYGIFLVFIFHLFKDKPIKLVLSYILLSFVFSFNYGLGHLISRYQSYTLITGLKQWKTILNTIYKNNLLNLSGYFFQARSIFSLIFIFLLKNKDNTFKLNKWVGYSFYPGHITILVLIKYFIIK